MTVRGARHMPGSAWCCPVHSCVSLVFGPGENQAKKKVLRKAFCGTEKGRPGVNRERERERRVRLNGPATTEV